MTSVTNPTYLLAPNWTFRPGGPIALGNIVADPFRPHRVLSKPAAAAANLPETVTATEINWRLATEKVRSINISLWARLFDKVRLDVGVHRRKAASGTFTMASLDTVYFVDEPSLEEIRARAHEPRVRGVLRADSLLRGGAVYMVTGLKIARGFRLTHDSSTDMGAHAGAAGEVAPEAAVGGKLEVGAQTSLADGFECANNIIFAYQLLRIRPKGWGKDKTIEIDEFQDDAAFLNDGGEEEEEEDIDVERDAASLEDLAESQQGVTAVELDDSQYAWLFQSE
jgi:hypothetical protein